MSRKKENEKKSVSKTQQRLFGMVSAYKNGNLKLDDLPTGLSQKIKSIADGKRKKTGDKRRNTKGVTKKLASNMASTKHKGLPETIKENNSFTKDELIDLIINYSNFNEDELEDMSLDDLYDLGNSLEIEELQYELNIEEEMYS